MKIIALMPVKNEEWILPYSLQSLSNIADEIIAIDDDSTDDSKKIIQDFGGIVLPNNKKQFYGCTSYSEYNMRQQLLEEGRKRGGTHFICIDADEIFTTPFQKNVSPLLSQLKPGHKLSFPWITLWKHTRFYRNDQSPWSNLYKDFIFHDDKKSNYKLEHELFINRTPLENASNNVSTVPIDMGAVLHFQFVPWIKTEIKQAWYRCLEHLKTPNQAFLINQKYSISLDNKMVQLKEVPSAWTENMNIPEDLASISYTWQLDEIFKIFDHHNIQFFEPLQIWHIPQLYNEFIKRVGRNPRPVLKPAIRIRIKNHISMCIPKPIKTQLKKLIKK
jgi:glycosyltransferase involved in cell wall biosynthesis